MSPSRIRSTLLSAGSVATAGSYRVVLVGPQSSIILKSISVHNQASVAGTSSVVVRHSAPSSVVTLLSETLEAFTFAEWQGWHVLQDGDEILLGPATASLHWWMSGTLLEGTMDQAITPLSIQQLPATPS